MYENLLRDPPSPDKAAVEPSYGWESFPGNAQDFVDSNLYNSYAVNDLRQSAFYSLTSDSIPVFDGAYVGSTGYFFSGIGTDEMYLTRAEGYARQGNVALAMSDLNTLLQARWLTGFFTTLSASTADEALAIILNERNKELPFTELIRWIDLRRLNRDSRFAKTLFRNLNGQVYSLPPNDNRYVYPIPPDEIKLSGIEQNPR